MDDTSVRSRKSVGKSGEQQQQQDKEPMLIKNRKPSADNYEFGELQKVPATIRDIMEKQFLRLFVWEFYFGERGELRRDLSVTHFGIGYIFWTIFFGIGPMVMFFPMVKLAIDGYEVLILSLASPIILGVPLINNLAEVSLSRSWVIES